MNFSNFIGNAELLHNLKTALAHRFPQVILLSGPAGVGKLTLAKLIASALLCTQQGAPCGVCGTCRKVERGIHPDVMVIDFGLSDIKIDTARLIRQDCHILPNESKRKVYIIRHSQNLNIPAQNVLLKSLEEPPGHAFFILTAENEASLLSTIRSRAIGYALSPLSSEELLPFLKRQFPQASPSELATAAAQSAGILGAAVSLLSDPSGLSGTAAAFCQALAEDNELAMYETVAALEKLSRQECTPFFSAFQAELRDAMLLSSGVWPDSAFPGKKTALSRRVSLSRLLQAYDFSCSLEETLPLNINLSLLFSAFCAGVYEICHRN
jgi:DNA polymerase-3 subunit delta'